MQAQQMERPIESYYTGSARNAKNARERDRRDKVKQKKRWEGIKNTHTKKRKYVLCEHGYMKHAFCLECTPSNVCACGSKIHRNYCCEKGTWSNFGRNKEPKKSAAAAEPEPAPAPVAPAQMSQKAYVLANNAEPAPRPEPAKTMRKVMFGEVEMMVENGATMTIAGVPITFN